MQNSQEQRFPELGDIKNPMTGEMKIFAPNASKDLAAQIARRVGIDISPSIVSTFADGEISMTIEETVRLSDVFIIQSTSPPVNENLMELLIMIDALKRASAWNVNAVIPYFGYARQDRKSKARDPISSKLVANLLTTAGADRVLTMDLHSSQVQGFFDIPFDHLKGMPLFTNYYKEVKGIGDDKDPKDLVIVSPDLGAVAMARELSNSLGCRMAIIDKRRPTPNESEVKNLIGEVKGKHTILIDDMIDTGGSLVNAAEAIMEEGALSVAACATHPVFSGDAVQRLNDSCLSEIIITDTIQTNGLPEKFKVQSVDKVFANAMLRIHNGVSVSALFD